MLDFEEFKKEVADNIKDFLPPEYADASVSTKQVVKNNDVELTSLNIYREGETLTPTIYLENFYEAYSDQGDMDDVMEKLADMFLAASENKDYDIGKLTSFEAAKDSIYPKLVNMEMNREALADMPHTQMDDLAVTYSVMLNEDERGKASVAISNEMMEMYGVTTEELHSVAVENMEQLSPGKFLPFRDMVADTLIDDMTEIMGGDREAASAMVNEMLGETPDIYVITNEQRINGAASVLDDTIMQKVTETVGEDFVILPSSVHECIVVPVDCNIEIDEMKAMVQCVNADAVKPQERLSDNVYCYDSQAHELVRAEKMEERKMERTAEKNMGDTKNVPEEKEKSSLSDRIAGKKKQVDEKHEPRKAQDKNKDTSL